MNELKELFLPYWSKISEKIVAMPAIDALKFVLKWFHVRGIRHQLRRLPGMQNFTL